MVEKIFPKQKFEEINNPFPYNHLGMFGNLDLVIDPYSSARSGVVHITASQLVDIQVGYNKAFNKITLTA